MQNFAIKFIFHFLHFCCRFPMEMKSGFTATCSEIGVHFSLKERKMTVDKTLHILCLNLSTASTNAKKIKSFEII